MYGFERRRNKKQYLMYYFQSDSYHKTLILDLITKHQIKIKNAKLWKIRSLSYYTWYQSKKIT